MTQIIRHDQNGPWSRRWSLSAWRPYRFSRWWLLGAIKELFGETYSFAVEMEVRSHVGQGNCYCPTGSISEVRVVVFGFGLWFQCGRDRGAKPCLCTLALCEAFPAHYANEIEEYGGMDRVKQLIARREKNYYRADPRPPVEAQR